MVVAELAYGFSGVAVWNGRRPRSSARFCACAASSREDLRDSSCERKSASSARKLRMRSWAFSCLVATGSCLAREWYSSMVRAKAVREAERAPMEEGVRVAGEVVRVERSRRMRVLCLRAELKVVFWGGGGGVSWRGLGRQGGEGAYHGWGRGGGICLGSLFLGAFRGALAVVVSVVVVVAVVVVLVVANLEKVVALSNLGLSAEVGGCNVAFGDVVRPPSCQKMDVPRQQEPPDLRAREFAMLKFPASRSIKGHLQLIPAFAPRLSSRLPCVGSV